MSRIEMQNGKPVADITITRVIAARRELVFQLWTEAKHLQQWWGPNMFTIPICEFDARPGGRIHIVMRGPDGRDYPMGGEVREIIKNERLVFTSYPIDDDGKPMLDGTNTVTFEDTDFGTRLTVHARAIGIAPIAEMMLKGMEMGWSQSITKLELLANQQH